MLLFFDKRKLIKHSEGHAYKVLNILMYITYHQALSSDEELIYSRINWSGESFLINPIKLIEKSSQYSELEFLQYVFVAGRRKYAEYKLFSKKTLDAGLVNTKAIANNRLLSLTGNDIHFKYED